MPSTPVSVADVLVKTKGVEKVQFRVADLVECLVKAEYRCGEQSKAETKHRQHFRPEDVHTNALQICAPQHNQEVTQRTCVSQVLQPLRHGADGKAKA